MVSFEPAVRMAMPTFVKSTASYAAVAATPAPPAREARDISHLPSLVNRRGERG